MTQERYFELCEQLGKEPDLTEMPPDVSDFPIEVQLSINIFNSLGDRVQSEIGYIGKDYTNLPILLEIYEIEDKDLVLDVLLYLDSRAIKKSSEAMKKERDKLKRQHGSKRN